MDPLAAAFPWRQFYLNPNNKYRELFQNILSFFVCVWKIFEKLVSASREIDMSPSFPSFFFFLFYFWLDSMATTRNFAGIFPTTDKIRSENLESFTI